MCPAHRMHAGAVWESCDELAKAPLDNKACLFQVCMQRVSACNPALCES